MFVRMGVCTSMLMYMPARSDSKGVFGCVQWMGGPCFRGGWWADVRAAAQGREGGRLGLQG